MIRTDAMRREAKHRDALRKLGRPRRVFPHEFAVAKERLRIARDEYGMSERMINEQTGLSYSTVSKVLLGTRTGMTRGTYDRIMTRLTPEQPTGFRQGAHVNPLGSIRRIQALAVAGFPLSVMEEFSGVDVNTLCKISRGSCTYIYGTTARVIAKAYGKLEFANPLDFMPPSSVARVRTMAKTKGWAGPGCWDEDTIDDPGARPEWTGTCGSTYGYRMHVETRIGMARVPRPETVSVTGYEVPAMLSDPGVRRMVQRVLPRGHRVAMAHISTHARGVFLGYDPDAPVVLCQDCRSAERINRRYPLLADMLGIVNGSSR